MVKNNVQGKAVDRWFDYFLVTLLIFMSGNPVVAVRYSYPFLGLASLAWLLFQFRQKDVKRVMAYTACFLLLFLAQYFVLGTISFGGSFNYLCKLFFGASILLYIGDRFRELFLNIITVLAAVSFVFYIPQLFGFIIPDAFPVPSDDLHSVFIYNANIVRDEYLRNCGPFWEPGAFAGFLFMCLLMYIGDIKQLVKSKPWHLLIICLAMLSTRSTGGYILMAFLLLYIMAVVLFRPKWWYYLSLVVFIVAVGVTFYFTPFLGEKIRHQSSVTIAQMDYKEKPIYYNSRSGSLVFDYYYLSKHPLVGNGLKAATRFSDHLDIVHIIHRGHSNGFSNYFAQFGIPMALLYFILLYRRLPMRIRSRLAFLLLYIILMQEEQYLNFPLFIALPFLLLPETCECRKEPLCC